MKATSGRLPDGRLHLQHGPIDLLVSLDGFAKAVADAEARALQAFAPVLETLVAELPALRLERSGTNRFDGPVARRMSIAVRPWSHVFVTPMAAVAGAVADHVLAAMLDGTAGEGLRRASVDNGGDIALWLAPGERYRIGVRDDSSSGQAQARIEVRSHDGVGGIATSGRGGRSHSLGIADAVTVLARDAAAADIAATLVANAVDLPGSAKVRRVPAIDLDPDTDLGNRLVTLEVAGLSAAERRAALDAAVPVAETAVARGLVRAVRLSLQGERRLVDRDGPRKLHEHAPAVSR